MSTSTSIQCNKCVVKNWSIALCTSSTQGLVIGVPRRCLVQNWHAYCQGHSSPSSSSATPHGTIVPHTGDKGWWTRQVHYRYIARTWTMYPPKTHLVHCKHIQNLPSQFHCNVPSTENAQYIHSVPSHVIAVSWLGNPRVHQNFSQRKYPWYVWVSHWRKMLSTFAVFQVMWPQCPD